jgi:hypothetical protein
MNEEIYNLWVQEALDLEIPEREIEKYVIKAHFKDQKPTRKELVGIRNAILKFIHKTEEKKEFQDLKELELKTLLSKEKPRFQSIGRGVHNGILYFGTKIYREGQYFDAVVTSDHKIYVDWKSHNEIKDDFKLNYRFPLFDTIVDDGRMWGNTGKWGIYEWRYGNLKNITTKEIFEDVLKLFQWKWWHPNKTEHKFHALNSLSNYFMEIFEKKPRLIIYGESTWGKTRLTDVYEQTTFNPSVSMDWSDSGIFRSIESVKPTVLIDNFDTLEDEKRKRILHIFNTGCDRKQKAIRSEGKTFKPTGFNVYGDMVLNSITPVTEVSESRSNITRSLRTEEDYGRMEDDNPIWKEIRDKCHVWALQNFDRIKKIYEELKVNKLFARELERGLPVLSIAKDISDKLYNEILKYFIEDNERRKIKDLKDDWVYLSIEKIIEKLGNENSIELKIKDVVGNLSLEIFDSTSKNFDRKKHGLSIKLGSTFKNCVLFPVRTLDGYPTYTFTKKTLKQFCRLKNFGEEIVKKLDQKTIKDSTIHKDSLNSLNSPHSPHSLNSPQLPNSQTPILFTDKKSESSECSEFRREEPPSNSNYDFNKECEKIAKRGEDKDRE